MKNTRIIFAFASVLVLLVAAAAAFGQTGSSVPAPRPQGIVDANGDGICDITGRQMGSGPQNAQGQKGIRGNGPGDGSGNQGTQPKNGTGFGSQSGKRTGPQATQAGAKGRRGGRP